jgi:hypothetical protein
VRCLQPASSVVAVADKCIPQHTREPRAVLAHGTKALILIEGEVGVVVHVHLKKNHENNTIPKVITSKK